MCRNSCRCVCDAVMFRVIVYTGMQDVHKSVGRRRLMAEPVPDAPSQQQAQQGGAAQASPIFAEEAGQIEPKHTRVIPRAPGTSPLGTQQADSAPGLKDAGASPVPDAATQQQQASGAGVIDTCDLHVANLQMKQPALTPWCM